MLWVKRLRVIDQLKKRLHTGHCAHVKVTHMHGGLVPRYHANNFFKICSSTRQTPTKMQKNWHVCGRYNPKNHVELCPTQRFCKVIKQQTNAQATLVDALRKMRFNCAALLH
jgi:hypothetical protein